jgi:WD40 repeat protein
MESARPRPLSSGKALALCVCICALARAATATEPPITSIAFSPNGKSVVCCSQAGLSVYSWPELRLQKRLQMTAINFHHLSFSPSGDRLAVGGGTPAEEGSVEILSWPEGKLLRLLKGHEDSVMAVAWRDESILASASHDHKVVLWDSKTGSSGRHLKGHSRGVSSLCYLTHRETLVSAGIDQSLRVWNADSGELAHSLNIHTRLVHGLALRPGDRPLPTVASASEDRTVRLWQPTIGRMVRFARLRSKPLDIKWLPDGSSIVVTCTDGHVRLIDPDTVEVTDDIPAVDGWAYSLAVHPTDGILVGGSDGQLRRVRIGLPKP